MRREGDKDVKKGTTVVLCNATAWRVAAYCIEMETNVSILFQDSSTKKTKLHDFE